MVNKNAWRLCKCRINVYSCRLTAEFYFSTAYAIPAGFKSIEIASKITNSHAKLALNKITQRKKAFAGYKRPGVAAHRAHFVLFAEVARSVNGHLAKYYWRSRRHS